ncbi:MAG: methyltransferase domain-containing protein [Caulobacteraceae bacterium]
MDDAHWKSDDWGVLNTHPDDEIARLSQLVCEEASIPGFIEARRFALEALRLKQGATLVELGVGPAPYAEVTMPVLGPTGTWIGIDSTAGFVRDAHARAARVGGCQAHFQCADAREAPVASGSADAAFADKLLIHVAPISRVVREMVRIVRPGGWVAACDAEGDALFIHASDLSVSRRILRHCAQVRPTSNAASLAAEAFAREGLVDVERRGFMILMSDTSFAFVPHIVRHWASRAAAAGAITAEEGQNWLRDVLGKEETNSVLVCFPLIVTWGSKP